MKLFIHSFATLIATWFHTGRFPKAPGTIGSLAALPFAYSTLASGGPLAMIFAALGLFMLGTWATALYMQRTGRQDPKEVVIDEVVGIFLILAPLPATWQSLVVGFILFRFFDIVKPWPIRWIDRNCHSAFGVMLDDVIAALYPYFLIAAGAVISGMAGYPLDLNWAFGWMF